MLSLHEKFWLDLVYKIRIRGSSPYSFILFNLLFILTLLELYDEFIKKAILITSYREIVACSYNVRSMISIRIIIQSVQNIIGSWKDWNDSKKVEKSLGKFDYVWSKT